MTLVIIYFKGFDGYNGSCMVLMETGHCVGILSSTNRTIKSYVKELCNGVNGKQLIVRHGSHYKIYCFF